MLAVSLIAVGEAANKTAPYSLVSITGSAYDSAGTRFTIPIPKSLVFFRDKRFTLPEYIVTTLGGASFNGPSGVAVDTSGNVIVVDSRNHLIRKVTNPGGVVTTLAGDGYKVNYDPYWGRWLDGPAAGASFNFPSGVTVDTSGNVIVADFYNNRIRKVTNPGGSVTTLAGSGSATFADGIGAGASFNFPSAVAVDSSGNIIVADSDGHRIRKVTNPGGVVTTLAGSGTGGSADGTGAGASFNYPSSVAVAPDGTIYVTDGNNLIRKVTNPGGVVTTLAGSGSAAFADGTGAGASFNAPSGVAVDSSGNVIVGDYYNHRIRKVTPGGVVTTLAGSGTPAFADGTGAGASFNEPYGIAVAPDGTIYVSDYSNNRIRKINLINSPPSAPANVQLAYTAGSTSISVSWNSVLLATSYTVNFYVSGNATPVQTFTSVTSLMNERASTFTLAVNTTYYASVSANNSIGSSAFQQSNNITTVAAENTIIFTTEGTAAVNNSSSGFYITSTPNKSTVSLQETLTFTAFNIPYQPGSPYAWFLNAISGSSIASNTNPITYNFTSMGNHTIVANVNSFPINGRTINASVNSLAFTVISLYNNSKTFESIGNPTIKLTNANSSPIWINVSGPQNLGITINSTQFTITSSGQISIYISNPSSVNTITITNNTSTLITVTIRNSSQYSSTATY